MKRLRLVELKECFFITGYTDTDSAVAGYRSVSPRPEVILAFYSVKMSIKLMKCVVL